MSNTIDWLPTDRRRYVILTVQRPNRTYAHDEVDILSAKARELCAQRLAQRFSFPVVAVTETLDRIANQVLAHHAKLAAGGDPVFRNLADVQAQSVDWLWHSRIAFGALNSLVGAWEIGKSLIAADMAARLSVGAEMPPADPLMFPLSEYPHHSRRAPANVVLLSAEDDPADTLRPRLAAAGADLRCVHVFEALSNHLLGGSNRDKRYDQAVAFLSDLLGAAGRQIPVAAVQAAASTLGISSRTLERARASLGVIAQKEGNRGPWMLRLPRTDDCTSPIG